MNVEVRRPINSSTVLLGDKFIIAVKGMDKELRAIGSQPNKERVDAKLNALRGNTSCLNRQEVFSCYEQHEISWV